MKKISYILTLFRAIISSLRFNFKYLPFKIAIRLPVLLYKPKLLELKGQVIIDSNKIHFGMIRLGFFTSSVYPNSGITIQNEGMLIFKGNCHIGNDSYVICGKQGCIDFGDDFRVTAGVKIVSECGIKFGEHTRFGWGGIAIDTNFHPLYDMEKNKFKKAFGRINVGNNNWFGMNCLIMPSVETPDFCIFGARAVVTRGGQYESYCVHGGSPIRVLSRNVKRIIGQDYITDYSC